MCNRLAIGICALFLSITGSAGEDTTTPQNAALTNTGAAHDQGLTEIVVTAERREETSQRAAIAISTLSGAAITEANATRPGGLGDLVPALQATDDAGPYSIFYVRGVGNFAANALSDPALSFNFDGVAVSRAGTSGFFYYLERVEVLKGRQGTLYGRNATGGAINGISKGPMLGELGGDASLQYGNYGASREDVALNLPMGDIAGVRLVMVNAPTACVDYHVPFGGTKGSSYGPREQGRYAANSSRR